ncbi:MAG: peptidylprolyl isomerase [Granulosicoccaceae bacterium]
MNKSTRCALTGALLYLSAFQPAMAQTAEKLPDGVAAMVNGRPVSELSVKNVMTQIAGQGETPDRKQILTELINLEVLTQAAEALGLNEKAEVAAALHLQYTQSMSNAFLSEVGQDIEVSNEELRAEYERQAANVTADEYNASHILLESEADAAAVINELASGGDFAQLAIERSTGPTGQNGGNLGWFQANSMVAEFSAALAPMKKTETSKKPVKTEFGWHVIQLNNTRSAATPDFESVKAGMKNVIVRNRLAEKLGALIEEAEITR